ncbi:hypothetical protein GCM10017673_43440 [Streptosporangium violaceochromogenes]|nr:hypothetical protein GCM10017673_43440 [Streptosporangium violaceochromogenes]
MAKGLTVTLHHMLGRSVTRRYPEVRPELPPRSRGVIGLVEENCTVCMLCARECPDWCIYIDSHKETAPAPEGGRPRARNVLDRFAIDFSLCMYCGICIEVCPFDALFWSPEFEYAEGDVRNLLHEKDRLAAWARTVPPPPAHEPGADPPKELAAASRPAGARGRSGPRAGGAFGPEGGASGPESGALRAGGGVTGASEAPGGPDAAHGPGGVSGPGAGSGGGSGGETVSGPGAGSGEESGPGKIPGAAAERESPPGRRPERPVRRASAGHASVRAIRPPGALPRKNGAATGVSAGGSPPSAGGSPPDEPVTGASPGHRLSTGGPPAEKSSTDEGDTPPAATAPEQTSAAASNGEPEEEM